MMWLQYAPQFLEDPAHFHRLMIMCYLLDNKQSTITAYNSLFDPISFIIGEADNVSVMDVYQLYKENGIRLADIESKNGSYKKVYDQLKELAKTKNKITPKEANMPPDKVNFMPQRYLPDNEILQEVVDFISKPTSKRSFPKGLDVFAGFGTEAAENLLINHYEEDKNWKQYPKVLKEQKEKFADYDGWDNAVYNKWIESLLVMQEPKSNYPSFMKRPSWALKNLNTGLASWAELKHDAILYAEQPMGAECGNGGVPPPVTVGYVEPNVAFWKKMQELMDLTKEVLSKYSYYSDEIESRSENIRDKLDFLLSASEKEIRGEKLSNSEYDAIEVIGSSFEYLTLSVIESEFGYYDAWYQVQGPDKSVAVVADIYTQNAQSSPEHGILHVATGLVNDIYVVVEIEGYLYLTKGATFSYYEFKEPPGSRLTDEEWQERLDKGDAPPIQSWMKDLVIEREGKPKSNEKIFYSSGC